MGDDGWSEDDCAIIPHACVQCIAIFQCSNKMAGMDYLMCAHLSDVPEINWCQAIVDDIKVKTRYLNDKIASNDKSTPNVQGCIAFLVVSFCQLFLVFCVCHLLSLL
jgi:hypothetical protein